MLFDDFAKMYLDIHSKPNKRSWTRDRSCIDHFKEFFTGRHLGEILPPDIEQHKKCRIGKVSPRTVNIELSRLRAMFYKAISWSKAVQSPVKHVKMLSEKTRRLRYLREDEIGRLIANCSDYLRPVVVMALNTGMCKGEILNLKWK